jgi:hypothetical protein
MKDLKKLVRKFAKHAPAALAQLEAEVRGSQMTCCTVLMHCVRCNVLLLCSSRVITQYTTIRGLIPYIARLAALQRFTEVARLC